MWITCATQQYIRRQGASVDSHLNRTGGQSTQRKEFDLSTTWLSRFWISKGHYGPRVTPSRGPRALMATRGPRHDKILVNSNRLTTISIQPWLEIDDSAFRLMRGRHKSSSGLKRLARVVWSIGALVSCLFGWGCNPRTIQIVGNRCTSIKQKVETLSN